MIPPEHVGRLAWDGVRLIQEMFEHLSQQHHDNQVRQTPTALAGLWLQNHTAKFGPLAESSILVALEPVPTTSTPALADFLLRSSEPGLDEKIQSVLEGLALLRSAVEDNDTAVRFPCLNCGASVELEGGWIRCNACQTDMGLTNCPNCAALVLFTGSGVRQCPLCTAVSEMAPSSTPRGLVLQEIHRASARLAKMKA